MSAGAAPLSVPWAGAEATAKVSGSPSGSAATSVTGSGRSSSVATVRPDATGARFTAANTSVAVATGLSSPPPLALKVKVFVPEKPAGAAYVNEPADVSASVPPTGGATTAYVSASPFPSVQESWPERGTSCVPLKDAATQAGASGVETKFIVI